MSNVMFLTVAALCYTVLTAIVFFSKSKMKTIENEIYKFLLCVTLCSLVIELLIPLYANLKFELMSYIVAKLYLICCFLWVSTMLYYTFVISNKKIFELNDKPKKYIKLDRIFKLIGLIFILLIIFLPMYFAKRNGTSFTEGPSVNLVFGISGTYMFLMILMLLKNIKNIKKKGYIPVITFVILLSLSTLIQKINPSFLIINFIFGFIACLMYHTIENPDLKMIKELLTNKELVENSLEERSRFLFKMSQDLRMPINNLQKLVESYKEVKNEKEKDEIVNVITSDIKNVSYIVNDVFDITEMEAKEIKTYSSSYETNNFFMDIEKKTNSLLHGKNVKLLFNISKDIPKYLYGDSIKLKQMLMAVIDNSVKYTEEGFIDINIDTLIRYDVCRLIIEIADSGKGMTLEKINNVLGQVGELSKEEITSLDRLDVNLKTVNKTLKLLGGSLNIRSDEDKGTTVVICIDQIIDNKKNSKNKFNYEKYGLLNKNKVLIINDNLDEIKDFENKFSKYGVLVNSSMFGNDAIKKIESGNTYSMIIIKDHMKDEQAFSIMKKLKSDKKQKSPIIVILENSQVSIKEHYIKDGFTDYIMNSNIASEIKRIYKKYL